MNMDNYLNSYLDRRMKLIIDDWQLGTKSEIRSVVERFNQVKNEVESLKAFERESKDRMDRIEERIRAIQEKRA